MSLVKPLKHTVRRLFRGADADLPQQCVLGARDPQRETRVFLRGPFGSIDVTDRHSLACGAPFALGVSLQSDDPAIAKGVDCKLQFYPAGDDTLLGEVFLQCDGKIEGQGPTVTLFGTRGFRNYCMSPLGVARQYAFFSYQRWRARNWKAPDEVKPTWLAYHTMTVLFICPRPVVLVSVQHEDRFNMFPMNLMSNAPDGHFLFSLNSHREASPLIQRAGRLAVCSIPVEKAVDAYALARNHRAWTIDESSLKFGLQRSATWNLPVPEYATRVRELEVVSSHNLGSHTLALARVAHDERRAEQPEYHMIHGIYKTWRSRHGLA